MESANASGKLVIVPTPIGNLGDMTLRSLEALREADVVCAEDTRVTGKLLAHFGIEKRLVRLDEAMIGSRAAGVVERVAAGEVVAYCSDAGMPGVSDPGLRLVAAAREAGVRFVTGDTKVVNRGHGDGIYINTSGVGALAEGVNLGGAQIRPGDAVLVSGTLGDHGITIMSCRESLSFSSETTSVFSSGRVPLFSFSDILCSPFLGNKSSTFYYELLSNAIISLKTAIFCSPSPPEAKRDRAEARSLTGAGEGNRTLVFSLGS